MSLLCCSWFDIAISWISYVFLYFLHVNDICNLCVLWTSDPKIRSISVTRLRAHEEALCLGDPSTLIPAAPGAVPLLLPFLPVLLSTHMAAAAAICPLLQQNSRQSLVKIIWFYIIYNPGKCLFLSKDIHYQIVHIFSASHIYRHLATLGCKLPWMDCLS